jgi:hypothetical protein
MQRMLIITLWKSKILACGPTTLGTRAVFFKRLCYSFFWMYLGREPTETSTGRKVDGGGGQLAGGWRGCLWALCQDLEALAEELGLKSSSQVSPCNWCEANESTMHWNNCDPDAKWRTTVWTGRKWLAKMRPTNEVFQLQGVTISTCAPDWMHNKHIGTDQYMYASVMKYTIDYVMPLTVEENQVQFYDRLETAYKDPHHPRIA